MLTGLQMLEPFLVGDVRAVLISDGEPCEDERDILAYVRTHLVGKLDCMYAGPEASDGYRLMRQIADAARGSSDFNVLSSNLPKLEQSLHLALGVGR